MKKAGMNDFEWRRQLRDLQQPTAPRRDLWPAIEAALDAHGASAAGTSVHQRRAFHAPAWLLVASFVGITLLALGLSLQHARQPIQAPLAATSAPPAAWKPDDPRLAGAAVELDAARMELRQAIEQAPDSGALQRLLLRTEQQQSRLRQLDRAG